MAKEQRLAGTRRPLAIWMVNSYTAGWPGVAASVLSAELKSYAAVPLDSEIVEESVAIREIPNLVSLVM